MDTDGWPTIFRQALASGEPPAAPAMSRTSSTRTLMYDESGFPTCFDVDDHSETQGFCSTGEVNPLINDADLQPITPRGRKKKNRGQVDEEEASCGIADDGRLRHPGLQVASAETLVSRAGGLQNPRCIVLAYVIGYDLCCVSVHPFECCTSNVLATVVPIISLSRFVDRSTS